MTDDEKHKPPVIKGGIGLVVLLCLLTSPSKGQQQRILDSSASFFVCEHHQTSHFSPASPLATVHLAGNPKSYQDGVVYNVTIKLQEDYDSVMITGVFSAASTFNGHLNQVNPYQHKMCAILHSYARQRPINRVDFLWKAPPEEMGCVDFVATLTRRGLVSSKGDGIFSICPVTASVLPDSETSLLSEVEEDGIIIRDDFEGSDLIPSLWKDAYFSIAKECQPMFQGKFALFCNDGSPGVGGAGYLTTVPLNLTTAEVLQFVFGQPTCAEVDSQRYYPNADVTVTISYGQQNAFFDNDCSNWESFKVWNLQNEKLFGEKMIALPKNAQKDGICLRWSIQTSSKQCVGLDNVVLTSSAGRASTLHADFDPFRSTYWYSHPGGVISNACHNSRGRALVFDTAEQRTQWATTRELDVASSSSAVEPDEILWKLNLEAAVLSSGRWEFVNGTIEHSCTTSSRHVVLHQAYEHNGLSVCSPNIDLSAAGTIRFRLEPWHNHRCQNESENLPTLHIPGIVNVWFDRADIHRKIMLVKDHDLTKDVTTYSLPVPSEAQAKDTRVCWQLTESARQKTVSPYILDDFYFLTSLPSPIDYVLQFRLNFACAFSHQQTKSSISEVTDDSEYHVVVQYSTDHGHQWNNLHNLCLPPACTGVQSSIQSTWSSLDTANPWERITLPIPYAAIANSLRLRFVQKGRALKGGSDTKLWAIDDIHVSNCLSGCHGHGTCVDTDKCSCDEGYEGPWCQFPTSRLPTVIRESFEGDEALGSSFYKVTGVELSARCGRVTSGLAAIFNRAGPRQLVTFDVNTVENSVLRFGLKMNGPRRFHQHHCPGPDRPLESIYVHSSCNGGVTWLLLRVIQPAKNDAKSAELIQIELPQEARGISCRFKVWQPHHSGAGRDVWVIDDFYLGPPLTDRLARHFAIEDNPSKDAFVGRHSLDKHCNRTNAMVLQPNEMEETYPVRIESFSILQIEAALGCGQPAGQTLANNSVIVQYSTDGGNHWTELPGSRRHASELHRWKRISLNLPPEVWSEETRFRVAQTGRLAERSILAVHYFYAGPNNCPELCRGNGRCTISGCICDEGFERANCLPSAPLSLLTPTSNSFTTNGGRFIDIDRDGCLVRGTNNIIFDSPGVRFLETKEIEYSPGSSVFFFLRLGECDVRSTLSDVHVNVELSWNGGSEWSRLAEYRSPFYSHPKLVKIDVPPPAGQETTDYLPFKIRFVQAGIHGKDRNVWSIAGLTSSSMAQVLTGTDIFNLNEPLEDNNDLWMIANDSDPKTSCLPFDPHCLVKVFFYGMVSREVKLNFGDSIQFDVAVPQLGFSNGAAEEVRLEYSSNGGVNWQLVRPECRHTWANCPGTFQSSRIDYRGLESSRNKHEPDRYYFTVSDEMAEKPILLRWLHQAKGSDKQPMRGFQLKNLYIGTACSSLCNGHGKCSKGICNCQIGYDGDNCSDSTEKSKFLAFYDTFPLDESAEDQLAEHWYRVVGGKVVPNYCHHSKNAVMFFGSDGPRMLQTVELDSQNLRMVQFTLGVTSTPVYKKSCRSTMEHLHGSSSNATTDFAFLVLDYSNDNGLTWNTLESWPLMYEEEKRLGVVLPHPARTPATMLRWWQLTRPGFETQSLFWYVDDVLVNINETNPITFEYELDPNDDPVFPLADSPGWTGDGITNWLGWQGLVSREEHHPVDTQLERNNNEHEASPPAYAETWDMEISDPTFAQFQLMVPPEGQADDRAVVKFEYSTDMGKHWRLVEDECFFIGGFCERLHPPSRYSVGKENNATRITVHLPRRAITRSTRFRWITDAHPEHLAVPWGIGHVYVGGICPWMCSGHGTCHHGFCQCDPGFGNSDCVPIDPLPTHIANHFDEDVENRKYKLTGGGISGGCGILSSGMSAVFHEGGLRYFESTDLDVTSGSYAQITVKFHCWAETENFMSSPDPFNHRLLLQYSVNGGITWTLIQEVMPDEDRNPQLVVANLMRIPDLTNSTRFRLWQPSHSGEGWDTWAVDSFVVQSLSDPGTIVYSTFHDPGTPNRWLTWLGGQVQSFCELDDALAFLGQIGDQQIFTADLTVTPETTLQFELNIGCESLQSVSDAPVRLEYSTDGGTEWELVVDDEKLKKNPYERMPVQTPTIYYSSTSNRWRRETISLAHLETTKPVRFRWTQGFVNGTDKAAAPHWALRNIVISPRCPEMCNGHGKCALDGGCQCDDGYLGDACELIGVGNPEEFHETFNSKVSNQPEWVRVVGGETISSTSVGLGSAMAVNQPGVRKLETRDLDLTHANFVQFYLDSTESSLSTDAVLLLQYSQNGGIQWVTFYVIHLNRSPLQEVYQVPIPPRATTPATRLRWWQVGEQPDGVAGGWIIDEIYIGGEYYAKPHIEDDFSSNDVIKDNWLFVSGGKIEPSCHSPDSSLHFASADTPMLATTKDIRIQGSMYLQYEITTGCDLPNSCNRIRLEYSTNYGLTWKSIPEDCVPGDDIDCQAYSLHTELLSSRTGRKSLITVPLPLTHGVARLRWTGNDKLDYDWSLNYVYVGSACGDCNGRGRCWRGSCICDADWKGASCEYHLGSLVSSVRETFDTNWNKDVWAKVNGGTVSSMCGTLDSGASLHFHETCDRFAETLDLDLRHIEVVQFHLRSNCGRGSTDRPGSILFQYSANGGVKWHTGLTLALDKFSESRLVSYLVPEEARFDAVKLRFWQLVLSDMEDWAIDSFIFDSTLNTTRSAKPESLALIDARADEQSQITVISQGVQKPTAILQEEEEDDLQQSRNLVTDLGLQLSSLNEIENEDDDNAQQSRNPFSTIDLKKLGFLNEGGSGEDDTAQYQRDEAPTIAHSKNLPESLTQKLWWRKTNSEYVGEHCGRRGRIMRGKSSATEDAVLETSDFFAGSLFGRLLSFDVIVGSCNHRQEQVDQLYDAKFPLRLEVSLDHGVTWSLFHSLKLRGEAGNDPQSPSVFVQLGKWKTYRYSLDHLSGFKYARFRWRQTRSSFAKFWAINTLNINIAEESEMPDLGLVPLMEDFNPGQMSSQWNFTSGGKVILPGERLGDGHALSFYGTGFKWLETANLDLTFGETVQFILQFQAANRNRLANDTRASTVFLQCSPDYGVNWLLMDEFEPRFYEVPALTHSVIPSKCRNIQSILRWWQSTELESDATKKSPNWLIDNVLVENSDVFLTEIRDHFRDGKISKDYWEFYPDGAITNKLCGSSDGESALNFAPLESSRFSGITSRHIVVKDNYAAYFKIKTACGKISCRYNNSVSGVRLELRRGYGIPTWTLLKPNCLPSHNSHLCNPQRPHGPSVYLFNSYESWQRVVIPLHPFPTSNWWQFRWVTHRAAKGERNNWSLRDVYIGKMCPSHCNSNGDCIRGRCHCDPGYEGPTCLPVKKFDTHTLPLMDHFEESKTSSIWESIHGAGLRVGCGSLLPQAHGKHLHFDGCGVRMATTIPLEAKSVRRIAFVIRIGTPQQIPTCRIQPVGNHNPDVLDKSILLQYSFDGVDWRLIASHSIKSYTQPQRMMYSVPPFRNATTVRFRWWQPIHGGSLWDQWAIDNVEILA